MANNDNLTTNSSSPPVTWDCIVFRFVVYTLIMGVMCVVGFVGNSLAILVLRRDRTTVVASFLLQCLAVADNCYLAVWLLNFAIRDLFKFLHIASIEKHPLWLVMRVYSYPLLYFAQTEMIWLTVVIALNRYMAVCVPYRATHLFSLANVRIVVACVTVFSLIYNLPRFFERYVHIDLDSGTGDWLPTALGKNKTYQKIYIDYLYYASSFVLPLLFLAIANGLVTCAYRRAQHRRRRLMMTTRSGVECERNITFVMILVVLLFIICQAPARFVQIVWSYKTNCNQLRYFVIHISNMLEVLNSSLNFVVYCLFHRRFRSILRSEYCCGALRGKQPSAVITNFSLADGVTIRDGCGVEGSANNRTPIAEESTSVATSTATSAVLVPSEKRREKLDKQFKKVRALFERNPRQCSSANNSCSKDTQLGDALICRSKGSAGDTMNGERDDTVHPSVIEMKVLVSQLDYNGTVSSKCATDDRKMMNNNCQTSLTSMNSSALTEAKRLAREKLLAEDPFGGVYLGPNE